MTMSGGRLGWLIRSAPSHSPALIPGIKDVMRVRRLQLAPMILRHSSAGAPSAGSSTSQRQEARGDPGQGGLLVVVAWAGRDGSLLVQVLRCSRLVVASCARMAWAHVQSAPAAAACELLRLPPPPLPPSARARPRGWTPHLPAPPATPELRLRQARVAGGVWRRRRRRWASTRRRRRRRRRASTMRRRRRRRASATRRRRRRSASARRRRRLATGWRRWWRLDEEGRRRWRGGAGRIWRW